VSRWILGTLNLNGIRSATRRDFGKWRPRTRADVLCLQELRIQEDQMGPEHRPPRGWKRVQLNAQKKGYSGVAIWSRLPVLSTTEGGGWSEADDEGRIVRMDTTEASVVSVYLPSGSSGELRQQFKESFMERLFEYCQSLLDEGIPVAICGDLNIAHTAQDIHNPTGNKKNSGFLPHEREWMSRLLEQGWVDLFRTLNPEAQEYSWWSQRGRARELDRGWRLDYILANSILAERATRCWIQGRKPPLSDHCAVFAEFKRSDSPT
jgi:exodeoxyribonuclease-3